jgi:hypothetical protein
MGLSSVHDDFSPLPCLVGKGEKFGLQISRMGIWHRDPAAELEFATGLAERHRPVARGVLKGREHHQSLAGCEPVLLGRLAQVCFETETAAICIELRKNDETVVQLDGPARRVGLLNDAFNARCALAQFHKELGNLFRINGHRHMPACTWQSSRMTVRCFATM